MALTERIIFALALARVAAPATLDPFLIENSTLKRQFTEFGGLILNTETGFIPTVETALFLVAGTDLAERMKVYRELYSDTGLVARQLVRLDSTPESSARTHKLVVPCLLYTSPSPRDLSTSRMPSSA